MTDKFDLSGISLIGEMSKEDLIEELTAQWRSDLSTKDMKELKQMVIMVRIQNIKERMIKEAGLKLSSGVFGFPTLTEEDE